MKNLIIYVALLIPIIGISATRDQKEIKRSYEVPANGDYHLIVDNIQGDVIVEGYAGNTIELVLNITVNADNQKELDQAMEELELDERKSTDELRLRMKAPFVKYLDNNRFRGGGMQCEGPDYDYAYDYKLRVPVNVKLHASTINDGRIRITNMNIIERSGNINGPIFIDGAKETADISTINGDIDITYAARPTKDSRFNTINGDITLELPADFSAEVQAKSMQGDLFSAFDYERIPPEVKKTEDRKGGTTRFEIQQTTSVKIGQSEGPRFQFETLNGDMFLKRI
ncbi:MAG: DUF4097 family beta strand repeat-containing protein [Cytophagales bacterium]|nr:DUF4097 family beta strand repeat-containing protein [Cytophagales bacterium]